MRIVTLSRGPLGYCFLCLDCLSLCRRATFPRNGQIPASFHIVAAVQSLKCSYVNTDISSCEGVLFASKMAFNALLVVAILLCMALAMIPPCLPHLGSEFCPSITATAGAATVPKWPAESVTYPDQMHQESVLWDRVFPRIDKKRMIVNTKLFTIRDNNFPQYFPNRHCKSKFSALVKQWLGYQAYGAMYVVPTCLP